MIKRFSCAALVILGALLPLCVWHYHNHGLPYGDAADYLKTVMRSYVVFQHDAWHGIKFLYKFRTWKTIFFPLIAFPSLLITKNNPGTSVMLTMMVVQALLAFYVYLFMRTRHKEVWASLLALVIMTVPLVVTHGTRFLTENVIALAVVAFYYHGSEALSRWDNKSLAAVVGWFTFGLLIRPIEALVIMSPMMIYVLALGRRRGLLSKSSERILLTLCLLGLFLVLLAFFKVQQHWPLFQRICWLLPLVQVSWGLYEYRRLGRHPLSLMLGLALLTLTFWYVPFVSKLVYWIYTCTFGEMAQRTGGRRPGDWRPYFGMLFKDLSGQVVLLLGLSALVTSGKRIFKSFPWLWFAAIVPTFALGIISYNSLSRYYTAPCLLLYILLALYSVHGAGLRKLVVSGLVLIALALNLIGIEMGINNRYDYHLFYRILAKVEIPKPWNAYAEHFDFLTKHIPKQSNRFNRTSVMLLEVKDPLENDQMPDPWVLGALSFQSGSLDDFDIGWTPKGASNEENIRSFQCDYDYFYIGPIDGEINYVWDNGSYLGKVLIQAWRDGKLSNFHLGDPIIFKTTPYSGRVMEFILLKTNPHAYGCLPRDGWSNGRLFE